MNFIFTSSRLNLELRLFDLGQTCPERKLRKICAAWRISECNFREIERARFARGGEHGSNTGAWERAGKTAA
ncbi:MAG: hypothetical protein WCH98_02420, partial [Verrucomicrobiota bacterium]